MIGEEKLDEKFFCPTCGQSMELKKIEEHVPDEEKMKGKIQFWYCLNCSIEWQIDIIHNILRKNSIIKR